VGFNFTKILSEKKEGKIDELKIENKLDIKDIVKVKSDLLASKDILLNFEFFYELDYKPSFAKVSLEGNFVLAVEQKLAKKILKDWQSKKIEGSIKVSLFNIILKKCNLKALQLEESLGIPFHFRLPSIKFESFDKKKE